MKSTRIRIRTYIVSVMDILRNNINILLAGALFYLGSHFLQSKYSTISGALFGAGASMLGVWVAEWNRRHFSAREKENRSANARRYLAPELYRTIDRVLYIHERAIPNFSIASKEWTSKKSELIKPNDLQRDFIPYMPVLYPNAPQLQDLDGDDASALITYYDSLCKLERSVAEWWEREGQLSVNIFNMIRELSDESLTLAEPCIQRFKLDEMFPPKHNSWGTLSSRITQSKAKGTKALENHVTNSSLGT